MIRITPQDVIRFYSKLRRQGDCLIWTDKPDKKGYGRFLVGKDNKLAHHVAFELHNKKGATAYLQHTCGNPLCMNPKHIVEGPNEGRPKQS